MARALTTGGRWPGRGALLLTVLLVLVLHAIALLTLRRVLQPPSILQDMGTPFYTRTIAPEAPAAPNATQRPTASITPAKAKPRKPRQPAAGDAKTAQAPEPAASQPQEAATPDAVATGPESPASTPEATTPALASASRPQPAASAPESATVAASSAEQVAAAAPAASAPSAAQRDTGFLNTWPTDTKLSYKLGGNYRGELHGDARVLWQRTGTRYQAVVEMSAGLLASLSFSSQGEITTAGLYPEVYEENVRGRRRGVRLGDDVRLNNGDRIARPHAVQDTASQFVELGHRFATGQVRLEPGTQIRFAMARPGGIDEWTYDVIGKETLHLPRLGPVETYHLKPRRLDKPRGPFTAEMWFAPSLQYLPVRIRITQDADTYLDLMVDRIEQR